MSAEQQELEKIFKEIYGQYHQFRMYTLYYKTKDGSINAIYDLYYTKEALHALLSKARNPDVDWALYIYTLYAPSSSQEYIEAQAYAIPTFIFFPWLDLGTHFSLYFKKYISDNDPLTQILEYSQFQQILPTHRGHHAFFCPEVYPIIPSNPDPISPFPGKSGIIAYCMSLASVAQNLLPYGLDIPNAKREFSNIRREIYERKRELEELWEKDRVKALDIRFIEKYIHHEIEKANKVMKQNGIIRVTFPLDQHYV